MRAWIIIGGIWALGILGLIPGDGWAQTSSSSKEARRYEIDAKRMDSDMRSADALPRSREFKRIDSTYYVGWMFEGVYLYEHAADYRGFMQAAGPLQRALELMEKDFSRELRTRTRDLMVYFPVFRYHLDYTLIAYYLNSCYQNLEDPVASHALLRRCLQWDFQRDFYMDAYNYLAWNTHRNRFLYRPDYPFQAEDIEGNLRLANRYLDTSLARVERNLRWNREIFAPDYAQSERHSVYHYKAMLHSYAMNLDSAQHYYDLLKGGPQFPQNNYGTFLMVSGRFREAEKAYEAAVIQDAQDKRLKEWAYYSSILDIYKGKPERGVEMMKGMIRAHGSTPGFGWYQIALGRAALYAGDLDLAQASLDKAAGFREMHIGTTLGQDHYEFSRLLLQWILDKARIAQLKFEHRYWWCSPRVLWKMAGIQIRRYLNQYRIIQRFSNNPERERVTYKLFASESTVTWDEIAQLIDGLSRPYFIRQMETEWAQNERPRIDRYFLWVRAHLAWRDGDLRSARQWIQEILQQKENMDEAYEQLFLAQVYALQARIARKEGEKAAYRKHMTDWFGIYPMRIPFGGLPMPVRLQVKGAEDKELIKDLKKWGIQWEEEAGGLDLMLEFPAPGQVRYQWSHGGEGRQQGEGTLRYKDPEAGARSLAYAVFSIGDSGQEAEEKETKGDPEN